jgi:hypothetical protein
MIGGHDISFRTESPAQVTDGAIRIVRAFWPDAILEDAETAELLDPNFVGVRELPGEVLIYKNEVARDSWAVNGAVPDNANLMIHIVRGVDSITIVVDDPSAAEMPALLRAICDHVYQDIFCSPPAHSHC